MIFVAITKACAEHGINQTIITWILKMLRDRVVSSYIGSTKVSILVNKGCPQGGILPPLLYCLVKDSLLCLLNESGFYSQGFADDLAILIIGQFTSTLCDLMQSALYLVESWCQSKEQIANPDKTKLILFTKKRITIGFTAPTFFGTVLSLSEHAKILGLYLDKGLTFILHWKYAIQKATASFWQCRRAFGKDWELSPKVLQP